MTCDLSWQYATLIKHIYELVLHSGSNIQGDAQISKPLNSIWKSKYCQVLCLEKGVENALFR